MHNVIIFQLFAFLSALQSTIGSFFSVDLFFLFMMSYDSVGGHLFKCLKILHPCNYLTLIRFIRHIMYALYIPELTGHVQSDRALFINIVSCNIAQYVCDYKRISEFWVVQICNNFYWIKVIFNIPGTKSLESFRWNIVTTADKSEPVTCHSSSWMVWS